MLATAASPSPSSAAGLCASVLLVAQGRAKPKGRDIPGELSGSDWPHGEGACGAVPKARCCFLSPGPDKVGGPVCRILLHLEKEGPVYYIFSGPGTEKERQKEAGRGRPHRNKGRGFWGRAVSLEFSAGLDSYWPPSRGGEGAPTGESISLGRVEGRHVMTFLPLLQATSSPEKRRNHHPTPDLKMETESCRGQSVANTSPNAAPKQTPEPLGCVQGQGAPCGECERWAPALSPDAPAQPALSPWALSPASPALTRVLC